MEEAWDGQSNSELSEQFDGRGMELPRSFDSEGAQVGPTGKIYEAGDSECDLLFWCAAVVPGECCRTIVSVVPGAL